MRQGSTQAVTCEYWSATGVAVERQLCVWHKQGAKPWRYEVSMRFGPARQVGGGSFLAVHKGIVHEKRVRNGCLHA